MVAPENPFLYSATVSMRSGNSPPYPSSASVHPSTGSGSYANQQGTAGGGTSDEPHRRRARADRWDDRGGSSNPSTSSWAMPQRPPQPQQGGWYDGGWSQSDYGRGSDSRGEGRDSRWDDRERSSYSSGSDAYSAAPSPSPSWNDRAPTIGANGVDAWRQLVSTFPRELYRPPGSGSGSVSEMAADDRSRSQSQSRDRAPASSYYDDRSMRSGSRDRDRSRGGPSSSIPSGYESRDRSEPLERDGRDYRTTNTNPAAIGPSAYDYRDRRDYEYDRRSQSRVREVGSSSGYEYPRERAGDWDRERDRERDRDRSASVHRSGSIARFPPSGPGVNYPRRSRSRERSPPRSSPRSSPLPHSSHSSSPSSSPLPRDPNRVPRTFTSGPPPSYPPAGPPPTYPSAQFQAPPGVIVAPTSSTPPSQPLQTVYVIVPPGSIPPSTFPLSQPVQLTPSLSQAPASTPVTWSAPPPPAAFFGRVSFPVPNSGVVVSQSAVNSSPIVPPTVPPFASGVSAQPSASAPPPSFPSYQKPPPPPAHFALPFAPPAPPPIAINPQEVPAASAPSVPPSPPVSSLPPLASPKPAVPPASTDNDNKTGGSNSQSSSSSQANAASTVNTPRRMVGFGKGSGLMALKRKVSATEPGPTESQTSSTAPGVPGSGNIISPTGSTMPNAFPAEQTQPPPVSEQTAIVPVPAPEAIALVVDTTIVPPSSRLVITPPPPPLPPVESSSLPPPSTAPAGALVDDSDAAAQAAALAKAEAKRNQRRLDQARVERVLREKKEQQAKEKAEQEKAEKENAEKEKADKEKADREHKEREEREAKDKIDKEIKEKERADQLSKAKKVVIPKKVKQPTETKATAAPAAAKTSIAPTKSDSNKTDEGKSKKPIAVAESPAKKTVTARSKGKDVGKKVPSGKPAVAAIEKKDETEVPTVPVKRKPGRPPKKKPALPPPPKEDSDSDSAASIKSTSSTKSSNKDKEKDKSKKVTKVANSQDKSDSSSGEGDDSDDREIHKLKTKAKTKSKAKDKDKGKELRPKKTSRVDDDEEETTKSTKWSDSEGEGDGDDSDAAKRKPSKGAKKLVAKAKAKAKRGRPRLRAPSDEEEEAAISEGEDEPRLKPAKAKTKHTGKRKKESSLSGGDDSSNHEESSSEHSEADKEADEQEKLDSTKRPTKTISTDEAESVAEPKKTVLGRKIARKPGIIPAKKLPSTPMKEEAPQSSLSGLSVVIPSGGKGSVTPIPSASPPIVAIAPSVSKRLFPASSPTSPVPSEPPTADRFDSEKSVESAVATKAQLLAQLTRIEGDVSKTESTIERLEKAIAARDEQRALKIVREAAAAQKAAKLAAERINAQLAKRQAEAAEKEKAAADASSETSSVPPGTSETETKMTSVKEEIKGDELIPAPAMDDSSVTFSDIPPARPVYKSLMEQVLAENKQRADDAHSTLPLLLKDYDVTTFANPIPDKGHLPWPVEAPPSVTPSPLALIYAAYVQREKERIKSEREANGDEGHDGKDEDLPELEPLKWPDVPLYSTPAESYVYRRNQRKFPSQRPMVMHLMRLRRLHRIDHFRRVAAEYVRLEQEFEDRPVTRSSAAAGRPSLNVASTPRRVAPASQPPRPQTPVARTPRASPLASPLAAVRDLPLASPQLGTSRSNTRGFMAENARNDSEYHAMMSAVAAEHARQVRIQGGQASIPSMILDPLEVRASRFLNSNGFIADPKEEERARKEVNPWTEEEKQIFERKYLKHPKQFAKVAQYLPNKTIQECVSYYYFSKLTYDYKTKVKQSNQRKRQKTAEAARARREDKYGTSNKPRPKTPRSAPSRELIGLAIDISNMPSRRGGGADDDDDDEDNGSASDRDDKPKNYLGFRGGASSSRAPARTRAKPRNDDDEDDDEANKSDDSADDEPKKKPAKKPNKRGPKPKADRAPTPTPRGTKRGRADEAEDDNDDEDDEEDDKTTKRARRASGRQSSPTRPESSRRRDKNVWSMDDRNKFVMAYAKVGKDFAKLSEAVGTKTVKQCRTFFANHRVRLGLTEPGADDDNQSEANTETGEENTNSATRETVTTVGSPSASSGRSKDAMTTRQVTASSGWTAEDRANFLVGYRSFGKKWHKYKNVLPNRTEKQIKQYYQSIAKTLPPPVHYGSSTSPRIQTLDSPTSSVAPSPALVPASPLAIKTGYATPNPPSLGLGAVMSPLMIVNSPPASGQPGAVSLLPLLVPGLPLPAGLPVVGVPELDDSTPLDQDLLASTPLDPLTFQAMMEADRTQALAPPTPATPSVPTAVSIVSATTPPNITSAPIANNESTAPSAPPTQEKAPAPDSTEPPMSASAGPAVVTSDLSALTAELSGQPTAVATPQSTPTPTTPSDTTSESASETSSEAGADPNAKPALGFKITTRLEPFYTGIDVTSKEEIEKRKKRAAKFGVAEFNPVAAARGLAPEEFSRRQERASKFGVDPDQKLEEMDLGLDGEEKEGLHLERARRWDVIHCSGTKMLKDMMSTRDILKYFSDYGPTHVEWINDKHCNVVFGDIFSAKRALVAKTILVKRTLTKEEESAAVEAGITPEDVQLLAWRSAHDSRPEATFIMRIAHVEDVKIEAKTSDYYKKLGRFRGPPRAAKADDQKSPQEVKKITLSRRGSTAGPPTDTVGGNLPGDVVPIPPPSASPEATANALAANLEATATRGAESNSSGPVRHHIVTKRDAAHPYSRVDDSVPRIVIGLERTAEGDVKKIVSGGKERIVSRRARPSPAIFRPKAALAAAAISLANADTTTASPSDTNGTNVSVAPPAVTITVGGGAARTVSAVPTPTPAT